MLGRTEEGDDNVWLLGDGGAEGGGVREGAGREEG